MGLTTGTDRRARPGARLPWALSLAVGAGCAVLGIVLAVRPFLSLAVLVVLLAVGLVAHGIAELLRRDAPWLRVVLAIGWIAAGVLVLAVPGLTIGGLVLVVGIALVLSGAIGAVRALRGAGGDRWTALALAVASVLLGVVALAWPDVTVFVVAAVLGVRLVLLGGSLVIDAIRRARTGASTVEADDAGVPPRARARRRTGAVLALVGAAALLLVSVQLSGVPRPDAFYDPPSAVPAEPGQLLRSEPFERAVPEGATAWRMLYTTTAADGAPAVASGLVVVPGTGDDHPVVAWAHGTTGYATGCAPSLLEEPFVAGAMPDLSATLAAGWAVVATDYAGLGTAGSQPYLIGEGEGRSVLDAIRAAQQLEAGLGTDTVLWGHSQGGHAALWAGGLAAGYAPELAIVGVAAMAPATDLPALLDGITGSPVGAVFGAFALAAYVEAYPEVAPGDYVRPGARIMVESMQQRCLTDPSTLVSLATSIVSDGRVWSQRPGDGELGERAAENVPTLPIGAPLLLAQGGADSLITARAQDGYVAARCAEGQAIDYRTYPGLDHMGVVTGESPLLPELRAWTADRFAGAPAADGCSS